MKCCENCINWRKLIEKRNGEGLGECMLPAPEPKFTVQSFWCDEFYNKPIENTLAEATAETVVQPGEIIRTHFNFTGYEIEL